MVGCDLPDGLCGAPCLPDGPCRQGWKLGASIAVVSQACVVVLTPLCDISTPRGPPSESTGIEHWGGARSAPRVVLVNVKLGSSLCLSVDSAKLWSIDGCFFAKPANVNLNPPTDRVTGWAANGAALLVPVACLSIVTAVLVRGRCCPSG